MESIHALKPVIKAAVFDLDGTLLDTEAISTIAIQQVLYRYGKVFTPDMKRRIIGLRGDLWTQLLINEFQLETVLNPSDFVKEWEINMAEYIRVNGVDVLPGGYEIVNEFHSKNIPMAIATSSNSVSVAKKIKNHELLFNKMKFIVCGDDKEVHNGKPAPDIYQVAFKRLNVDPVNCLVFEDAVSGIVAAKSAGVPNTQICAIPNLTISAKEDFEVFTPLVLHTLQDFDHHLFKYMPLNE